ncbi:MAG: hypothetical protein ACTSU2_14920 [Promethearchaeota archaeon]
MVDASKYPKYMLDSLYEFLMQEDIYLHKKGFLDFFLKKCTKYDTKYLAKNGIHADMEMSERALVAFDLTTMEPVPTSRSKLRPDFQITLNGKIVILIELELFLYYKDQLEQLMNYFMALSGLRCTITKKADILENIKYLRFHHIVSFALDISSNYRQDTLLDIIPTLSDTLIFIDVLNNWKELPKSSTAYKAFHFIDENRDKTKKIIEENFIKISRTIEKLGQKFYFYKLVIIYGGDEIKMVIERSDRVKEIIPPEEEVVDMLVTDDWLERLTPEQISKLSPKVVKKLTPKQLESLTPEQLKGLTPEQLKGLTPEQLKGLTPEQIKSIPFKKLIPKIAEINDEELEELSEEDIENLQKLLEKIKNKHKSKSKK